MNKDKQIKDLKERNDKLKNQYQLQEIRLHSLEYEKEKLHKELDYADNYNIYLITKLDKIKEEVEHYKSLKYGTYDSDNILASLDKLLEEIE